MRQAPYPKTILDKEVVGLKTPMGSWLKKPVDREDFSKCGGKAHVPGEIISEECGSPGAARVVREDPRNGKMTGPFSFPLDKGDGRFLRDPAMLGIGGAPTRATTLPEAAADRKKFPVASGVLDYFPDALVAISHLSFKGNEQHNPGKPLHWARGKSMDHADTMLRHFLQRGTVDTDGVRHSVKMAWRALALLQCEIEAER